MNSRVSFRGGRRLDRLSVMHQVSSQITIREEEYTNAEGNIPDIQILEATAFVNLLASEEVICTFLIRLGECTGLWAVTMESIWRCEKDINNWMGEKEVVRGVAAEEQLHGNLECLQLAHLRPQWRTGQWILTNPWANNWTFGHLGIPWLLYICDQLSTKHRKWSWRSDQDGAERWWVIYHGHIWRCHEGFQQCFNTGTCAISANCQCNQFGYQW